MRVLTPILPAMLVLSACSTAEPVTNEMANATIITGAAIENGVDEISAAAGKAIDSLENQIEGVGATVDDIASRDAWVGRWTGPEGTFLAVTKAAVPGRYTLEMQYTLDAKGRFDGVATSDGIAFTRPDGDHVLRASDGDATGLKYLSGKKDCLKVKDSEGYCRD